MDWLLYDIGLRHERVKLPTHLKLGNLENMKGSNGVSSEKRSGFV